MNVCALIYCVCASIAHCVYKANMAAAAPPPVIDLTGDTDSDYSDIQYVPPCQAGYAFSHGLREAHHCVAHHGDYCCRSLTIDGVPPVEPFDASDALVVYSEQHMRELPFLRKIARGVKTIRGDRCRAGDCAGAKVRVVYLLSDPTDVNAAKHTHTQKAFDRFITTMYGNPRQTVLPCKERVRTARMKHYTGPLGHLMLPGTQVIRLNDPSAMMEAVNSTVALLNQIRVNPDAFPAGALNTTPAVRLKPSLASTGNGHFILKGDGPRERAACRKWFLQNQLRVRDGIVIMQPELKADLLAEQKLMCHRDQLVMIDEDKEMDGDVRRYAYEIMPEVAQYVAGLCPGGPPALWRMDIMFFEHSNECYLQEIESAGAGYSSLELYDPNTGDYVHTKRAPHVARAVAIAIRDALQQPAAAGGPAAGAAASAGDDPHLLTITNWGTDSSDSSDSSEDEQPSSKGKGVKRKKAGARRGPAKKRR